jgi:hypothetical protein
MVLAGVALAASPPAGARSEPAPAAGAQERARAILADPRYQTHPPSYEAPKDLVEGETAPPLGARLPAAAVPVLGAGAALTQIVFIVLAAAALVLVLVWIGMALFQRVTKDRQRAESEPEAGDDEAGTKREVDVEDATRLAAEGRYGEAIHALLLAAIHHFATRAHLQDQPSRTSRELARLLPLSGESRAKFNDLVIAVERTLFGGEVAGAEDYQRSLERFRSLVWRPA